MANELKSSMNIKAPSIMQKVGQPQRWKPTEGTAGIKLFAKPKVLILDRTPGELTSVQNMRDLHADESA